MKNVDEDSSCCVPDTVTLVASTSEGNLHHRRKEYAGEDDKATFLAGSFYIFPINAILGAVLYRLHD